MYTNAENYLKRFPVEVRSTEVQSFDTIKEMVARYATPGDEITIQEICDATGHINDVRTVHYLMEAYNAYKSGSVSYYTTDMELPKGEENFLENLATKYTNIILSK